MSLPVEIVLQQMITNSVISQCIYVAAKLGISDILASGTKNITEIASKTNTHSGALYRLLRTLASVGIYAETTTENFVLTPLAELLKTDIPNSLNAMALMWGESWHLLPWLNLMSSVKTGENSFEEVFKKPVFAYFQENPEANTIFNDTMTNFSSLVKDSIAKSYDFSGVNTIVDVAGGQGIL
ncbi:MAG TPA: methyltransferase, partial [Allocoleopsis sp.]